MNDLMEKRVFKRGWMAVKQRDVSRVRAKIMDAVGVTTWQSFRNRLNGITPLNEAEIEKIEEIFKNFGITDVWGDV
jgi:hypothetical protein